MKASAKKTYSGLEKWFSGLCENGNAPFSITLKDVAGLGGARRTKTTDFSRIKARWTGKTVCGESADGKFVSAVYEDEKSHLRFELEATLWADVPALDYVVTVKNTSQTEQSPVITGFSPLDAAYPLASKNGKYILGNGNGSLAKNADFERTSFELGEETLEFAETFGRSTDGAWPYFDVDGEKGGFLLAIGWSGNWQAKFENAGNAVNINVAMWSLNSYLLPGESIRSERIVLVANDGDNEYGHNLWRKMVVSHYTPYCRQGRDFKAPISMNFWGGRNTAFITKVVKLYADAGIPADVVWMDAGWYGTYPFMGEDRSVGWGATSGGSWYAQLGYWDDDRNLYPNGIKEVGDFVHANSPYKLMLWWMLEDGRVNPFEITYEVGNGEKRTVKTDVLARQTFGKESYYDELIDVPGGRKVLKLSDEKVFIKVLNYYRNRFSNDSLDYMRIDYWSRPEAAWAANDRDEAIALAGEKYAAYRRGMSENKYIVNLYRFFDTMYKEFPDWMLDNCCSGGRRIDIEMALRGIPLWRTDYNNRNAPDYSEANQVQTQYLNRWLPLTGIGVTYPTPDKYYERSFLTAGPSIETGKFSAAKLEQIKEMVGLYVRMRPYYYGEYYQLLPVANNKTDWQAYEYYREDLDSAAFVAIAREETTETERRGKYLVKTFKLKGLDRDTVYTVSDADDPDGVNTYRAKGAELMTRGIRVTTAPKRVKVFFAEASESDEI